MDMNGPVKINLALAWLSESKISSSSEEDPTKVKQSLVVEGANAIPFNLPEASSGWMPMALVTI